MKTARFFDRFLTPAFRACLLLVVSLFGRCQLAVAAAQPRQMNTLTGQQFFCNAGYDRHECARQIARLKAVLIHYPAGVQGPWSWVIVRSEDWQPLLSRLHLDRRSPAFTFLDERETFLEEALFFPRSIRTDELVRNFRVPVDRLLSIAVSHELGHAICHGGDEATANRISDQLRNGQRLDCSDAMKSPGRIEELYLRNQFRGLSSRR
jgi:hypothetical protein